MCLILQLNKESQFTEEQFKTNLERNSHGTGIMFANNNKIIVKKELESKDKQISLFNKYMKAVKETKSLPEVFIHSRFATHGEKNYINCHPYEVLKATTKQPELYCMHNGVINHADDIEKDKSDTFNFLKYYVKPLIEGRIELLQNEQFQQMLSKYIGTGSKLVFLDSTGLVTYINKEQGAIYKGCWISNTSSGISDYEDRRKETIYYQNNYKNIFNSEKKKEVEETQAKTTTSLTPTITTTSIKKEEKPIADEEKDPDAERFAKCVTLHNTNWFDEEEEEEELKAQADKIAIDNGIPLVCTAISLMDERAIHKFALDNPILAGECLSYLISNKQITFKI